MMGRKWKRPRSPLAMGTGIDLLSTAFGLPCHWDIKGADRKLPDGGVYQYESDSDETIDSDLEPKPTDARTPQETSQSSNRRAFGRRKTSIFGSLSRKRQQSQRHASPSRNQQSILRKDSGNVRSVKAANEEQKSKHHRSQSKERNKTPTPIPPGSCTPRHNQSRNVPGNYGRGFVTFCQHPFVMTPTCRDGPPSLNTHPQYASFEAQGFATPMLQHSRNLEHRFAQHHVTPPSNGNSKQKQSPLPKSETQELLDLQSQLNDAQERLSKEPGNSQLRRDRSDAQQQLNKFMDALVAEKSHKSLHASSTAVKQVSGKEQLSLQDDAKENVAPDERSAEPQTSPSLPSKQQADQTLRLAVLKSGRQSNTVRHHLCSGCGDIRSREFHDKNPVGVAKKPILNYCSACRERRFNKKMTDLHHFCFGCGKVRSKVFQEKYKAEPGELLLPNYCGSCTDEVRLVEDNNEASVLGAVIREGSPVGDRKAGVTPDSSTVSSACGNFARKSSIQVLKKSRKGQKISQLDLGNISSAKNTSSPVSPAESSPFYPGRRLGSAQRRAQRGSTPHPGEAHVAASGSLMGTHEYHTPYVEELFSETESSEPASHRDNTERLDSDAESTRWGGPQHQVDGRGHFAENGQRHSSHETPRLAKSHLSSGVASLSSERQTPRPRRQHQARYDGLDFHAEQPRRAFDHSGSANTKRSTHLADVFGNNSRPDEARSKTSSETMTRRRSPLADFKTSNFASYFGDDSTRDSFSQDNTNQPEMSHFPSSRGAFGRKESHFSIFDYSSAGSGRSGSNSLDGSNTHNTSKCHCPEGTNTKKCICSDHSNCGESSFSSSSSSGKTASKNDQIPVNNIYSRSVFTDYSCATSNPYFNPRRRQYPTSSEGAFLGSWDRSRRKQPPTTSRANGSASFDDRIPEPIVEEPASAPSTPVQKSKLLEFRNRDNLDALDLPSGL